MQQVLSGQKQQKEAPCSTHGCMPLPLLPAGGSATILSVRGKDETRHFLANLGFVEGADVSVISEMGGNLIVRAKGASVAIGRQMAMRVMVG